MKVVPGLRVAAILAVTQTARVNDRGCATACFGKGLNYGSKRRLFPLSREIEDSPSEVCANATWFSSIKEDSVEEKMIAQNSRSHLSATETKRVASVVLIPVIRMLTGPSVSMQSNSLFCTSGRTCCPSTIPFNLTKLGYQGMSISKHGQKLPS
jgi:hypothetical protein